MAMDMDGKLLLLTAIVGGVLAVLYWLYSFFIVPFRVLSRCGIQGPPPTPFFGNLRAFTSMGRLKFTQEMLKKYGKVFG